MTTLTIQALVAGCFIERRSTTFVAGGYLGAVLDNERQHRNCTPLSGTMYRRLPRVVERVDVRLDVFNVLNASSVLALNNNFATWQRPQSIMYARFMKLGMQIDF